MALIGVDISSALLQLFSGDGARHVAVIETFVDESGTHRGAPIISVAAALGDHEQWQTFLKQWHHTDFHARESQSDPFKPDLANLIEKCGFVGGVSWMNPQDYTARASHQYRSLMGNAYVICAFSCVGGFCGWARKYSHRLAVIIENGQPNTDYLVKLLNVMARDGKFRDCIASVGSANKADFLQLHVADFIAHAHSTRDQAWWPRLSKSGLIIDEQVDHNWQKLSENAAELAELYKRDRETRKGLRRLAAKAKNEKANKNDKNR